MEEQLIERTEEKIKEILEAGIDNTNLDSLYKLTKIKHMIKEEKEMNYGRYYGEYGRGSYGNYGARGYDAKYRGHDNLDRVYSDYGRYMESRERYGASEETDKSFHYMIKSLEDFVRVLYEEANTPQQKQELMQSLQNLAR